MLPVRLEDGKIARMGQYIILFELSSSELPATFFKKVVFVLTDNMNSSFEELGSTRKEGFYDYEK